MPPGTGDVPLTVFQSIPLDGIVVVTLPQDLVSMIVKKSYNMAQTMNIPVLGIVENMSYVTCPHCGEEINLFGSSSIIKTAEELGIKQQARMPIDPEFTQLCDQGRIEEFDKKYLDEFIEKINAAENIS
jgi:Mrp family chromosome partitioning ATPase